MRKKVKLVSGAGINDSHYATHVTIDGARVICPFYQVWSGMIKRCYSAKFQSKHPTYAGCMVSPEWMSFMAFRAWMEKQPWQGMEIDKDLLKPGNKVYGPETCVFVSSMVNLFATDSKAARGKWPIGVSWNKREKKFEAYCSNPITGKREHFGYFTCPDAAHGAWRKRKHELALQLSELQEDRRLMAALATRYLPEECVSIGLLA